jgi:hypothetical protein
MRFLKQSLEAEQALFELTPTAIACLREKCEAGDVVAAQTILRYTVVPVAKREGLAAELERERLKEREEDGDGEASAG